MQQAIHLTGTCDQRHVILAVLAAERAAMGYFDTHSRPFSPSTIKSVTDGLMPGNQAGLTELGRLRTSDRTNLLPRLG